MELPQTVARDHGHVIIWLSKKPEQACGQEPASVEEMECRFGDGLHPEKTRHSVEGSGITVKAWLTGQWLTALSDIGSTWMVVWQELVHEADC